MKRLSLAIVLFMTAFICSGCGLFGPQKYTCDESNVVSAQIVHLDRLVEEEYRYEYTVLREIPDTSAFIERLISMKHTVNWGDPQPLEPGYIVIRLEYLNEDYDLIHASAQLMHQSGKNRTGYFFFDKEQFDTLLADYLSE